LRQIGGGYGSKEGKNRDFEENAERRAFVHFPTLVKYLEVLEKENKGNETLIYKGKKIDTVEMVERGGVPWPGGWRGDGEEPDGAGGERHDRKRADPVPEDE
jgi:hypothetical protein